MSERERAFHVAARSPGRKEDGRYGEQTEACKELVVGTDESIGTDGIVDARTASCDQPTGSRKSTRELNDRQICA